MYAYTYTKAYNMTSDGLIFLFYAGDITITVFFTNICYHYILNSQPYMQGGSSLL